MLRPIRCFTCNKVLGALYNKYDTLLKAGVPIEEIYKTLGLTRYCCKMCIRTSVCLIDKFIEYNKLPYNVKQIKSNDKRIYLAR